MAAVLIVTSYKIVLSLTTSYFTQLKSTGQISPDNLQKSKNLIIIRKYRTFLNKFSKFSEILDCTSNT